MISSLESTIYFFIDERVEYVESKREKLKQKSYSNYEDQIDILRNKIENKVEIISNYY